MVRQRGHRCAAGFLVVLSIALCTAVHADAYPSKPVRIIVGFAPGGGTDIIARYITQRLSESFGSRSSWRTSPERAGL